MQSKYKAVGPAPKNGQKALDNSVSIAGDNNHRVGIDLDSGEVVVFGVTPEGKFGGDVRTWSQLTDEMKTALVDNGLITEQGEIILRDKQGRRSGLGKNVMREG